MSRSEQYHLIMCAGLYLLVITQGSSETAAESLLMLDDAAALAAAEQRVQQLSKQQQQQQNAGAMDVDGHDPTGRVRLQAAPYRKRL